jgi:hypothetical protein
LSPEETVHDIINRSDARLAGQRRAEEAPMKTNLRPVSKARSCPVCGKGHKCSTGADGLIICGRQSGDVSGFVHLGPARGDPQFHLYRREGDPKLAEGNGRAREKGGAAPKQTAADWAARAEEYRRALTPPLRRELTETLGVPENALVALGTSWCPRESCWTFPEVDGAGAVVGITRRFRDSRKRDMEGGRRGLYVAEGWRQRGGPILLPEGPSDTAALTALGLAAVGRPSNMTGAEQLGVLLADVPGDCRIIVVGDLDPKGSGDWPGKDGAMKVAGELAGKLGRPVHWVLPPDGTKDVRKWLNDRKPDLTCADVLNDLGAKLAEDLEARCKPAQAATRETTVCPLGWLREHGVPVASVRKLGRVGGEYELVLDDGRTVELGRAADVLTPRRVQAAVADVLAVAIPLRTLARWRPIGEAILAAAEVVDCGCDPADELAGWVRRYLSNYRSCLDVEDLRERRKNYAEQPDLQVVLVERLRDGRPAAKDGHVYLTLLEQHEHLIHRGVRITQPELARRLRRSGWTPAQLAARTTGGPINARAWRSPENWKEVS